jgi:hypothetical protein
MRLYYVNNGVVHFKTVEDMEDYIAHLRPSHPSETLDTGELLCAQFVGGTDSASMFIIFQPEDIPIMEDLAAKRHVDIQWKAVQFWSPDQITRIGIPLK